MKKTLVTIVATVVATVAVLALVAYTYFHIENQAEQRFAELHRNVFTKLDAQDPVAAEQLLLAAVADEAFSAPEYQFSLNGMLAGLNSEYKKDAAAAERYTMAALAVDASAFPPLLKSNRVHVIVELAATLDSSGRYGEAIKYFHEAASLAREVNPALESQIIMSLGIAYVHDGDFDRGEYYLEETRKRAEAQSPADPYMKALAYNNLAWMYLRGKQYGKALPPAQEGLRIAEVLGDKGVLSTINDTQAQILLAMKRFDEALSFSEKSLSGPAGSDYVSAVQYRTHATILASLDRKADSCKSLAKAQEFYAKARNEKERSATQQEAAALAC